MKGRLRHDICLWGLRTGYRAYELRYAGKPCKLEPRVFNVLAYLIQHRTSVVTREELLDTLWPGLCNGVALLNACIMEARKAVGDSGQAQQVIKTIHGRGYRFIAPTMDQPGEEPAQGTPKRCDIIPLSPAPPAQEDMLASPLRQVFRGRASKTSCLESRR